MHNATEDNNVQPAADASKATPAYQPPSLEPTLVDQPGNASRTALLLAAKAASDREQALLEYVSRLTAENADLTARNNGLNRRLGMTDIDVASLRSSIKALQHQTRTNQFQQPIISLVITQITRWMGIELTDFVFEQSEYMPLTVTFKSGSWTFTFIPDTGTLRVESKDNGIRPDDLRVNRLGVHKNDLLALRTLFKIGETNEAARGLLPKHVADELIAPAKTPEDLFVEMLAAHAATCTEHDHGMPDFTGPFDFGSIFKLG